LLVMVSQIRRLRWPSSTPSADRPKRSAGLSDGQIMFRIGVLLLGLGAAVDLVHYLLISA